MQFRSAIFVFTQSFFKFHKNGGLSDCERMISVDYIMNALEHSKVRLAFFDTPCIISSIATYLR